MQAASAKNETRLPRAVLKVSEAIKAHIDARNEPKTDPVDPNAPPVDPSAQATPPADPNPPADPRAADPAYWKQRFEVTAGVLKAERDGRKADAQGFQQQISELREQMRSLQTTQTPSTAVDLGQFFTPEQVTLLGEDEATAIAKAALSTAQKTVKDAIEAEIKPLKDAAKNAQVQEAKDRATAFQDKLTEQVPNWQAIDAGDDWKAWLAEEDESTGVERQGLLDAHVSKANAVKVAAMFRAFLKTKELPVPPVTPNGTGASPGGEPPVQPNPQGLGKPTPAEVKDFYKRAALGKVKDQERIAFEARLRL